MSHELPKPQIEHEQPTSSGGWLGGWSGGWRGGLGAAWLLGFCFLFFQLDLYNSEFNRREIALQLPVLLLELVDPQPADPQPSDPPASSGWQNFPQRFDLLLTATIILAAAWGLGQITLRAIGLYAVLACPERLVFAFALGLSGLSLITLGCGLAGILDRRVLGSILALGVLAELLVRILSAKRWPLTRSDKSANGHDRNSSHSHVVTTTFLVRFALVVCIVPFLLAMLLGSMLPPMLFDVKEYHLQGPKEFFQAGNISMLPHNVYTSFPFLTEMLSLLAMVIRDDWYWGALAGKAVLMSFAPLTALALFAAGRRCFNPTVGILAAAIHLSTPWVYRISIIAYAEGGLTFYLFATLLAVMLAVERIKGGSPDYRMTLLAGLMAGSGMACKYTGLVQIVIPMGLALGASAWLSRCSDRGDRANERAMRSGRVALQLIAWFGLGTALTIGPWLLKNAIETSNPVYPLMYSVFGGTDWDAPLNERWKAAHSPNTFALDDLVNKFFDVTMRSDWQSPLLFGLAPLALCMHRRRMTIVWLWAFVLYLFFAWWSLTHRIDRFWVPLLPVLSLLAGIGATWSRSKLWRLASGACLAAAMLFNLAFVTTRLCGPNFYLADLTQAAEAAELTEPGIAYINQLNLPAGTKVLCVGAASVFDARFPVVYNTVFDKSIFQQWCAAEQPHVADADLTMQSPTQIRHTFARHAITYVYVNWQEILRYRPTYGYTDFVTPARFHWLQQQGILGPEIPTPYRYSSLDSTSARLARQWAPELVTPTRDGPLLTARQIFPVLTESKAAAGTAGTQPTDVP